MYTFTVTPEFLLVLASGALALVLDYFPVVAKWFDALTTAAKRQLNAALVIGSAAIIFAGTCFGLFVTNLMCTARGGFDLLYIVFLAIGVNQGVHLFAKPTKAFKARMFGTVKQAKG